MSRLSVAPKRGPSLVEELEQLEQSITLTLQEIDHNFSKAHRIVTSSIIPIVESYAQHSQNVWEGSKFWKQFFEASANVSLSGYEEPAADEETTYASESIQDSSLQTPPTRTFNDEDEEVTPGQGDITDEQESSLLSSPSNTTGVMSTPKIASSASRSRKTPPASRSRATRLPTRSRQPSEEPSTPRPQTYSDQIPSSSPFAPPSALQPSTAQRQNHDPLLHRVLDKTYRIQATPHGTARKVRTKPPPKPETPLTATRSMAFDSSPASSPAMPAPQLRSELFSPAPPSTKKYPRLPRTPGVPIASPEPRLTSTGRPVSRQPANPQDITQRTPALWDSDDEDDTGAFDMSPPKTMQFVVPTSRLMQTPAREASRRIVADLLSEAGAQDTDEIEFDDDVEPPSPTVVRALDDDSTF
ncbi:DASH complex subunit Ask1-domain-containing protein [Elsinoe ampelina]|uniref:DASH complex subunit ASK1 n=1 Tax=Elsinoe ampelina TaxID=302913 RepID=A0A6A6GH70_9PEZI|nr:DASH complex subunit Ask1-domain-containing protein [Elsinoe ampelina]